MDAVNRSKNGQEVGSNRTECTGTQPMGWYAVYTAPRAEKQVYLRLIKMDIETFLPTLRVRKVWSDRIKWVDEILFPSYVFVHCSSVQLRALLLVEGVVRVVYYNGGPALIKDVEIQEIKNFLACAEEGQLEVGEQVQILTGGLKLVTGKVKKIGRTHLYLYLDRLGALVCVRKENVIKTAHRKDSIPKKV